MAAVAYGPQNRAPVPNIGPRGEISASSIQKMLDENHQLIMAIIDYQTKGQSEECAKYQGQLHRNLVYLATIADSNNQTAQGKHPPGRRGIEYGPHGPQGPADQPNTTVPHHPNQFGPEQYRQYGPQYRGYSPHAYPGYMPPGQQYPPQFQQAPPQVQMQIQQQQMLHMRQQAMYNQQKMYPGGYQPGGPHPGYPHGYRPGSLPHGAVPGQYPPGYYPPGGPVPPVSNVPPPGANVPTSSQPMGPTHPQSGSHLEQSSP